MILNTTNNKSYVILLNIFTKVRQPTKLNATNKISKKKTVTVEFREVCTILYIQIIIRLASYFIFKITYFIKLV